ncbi:MAG: hypothetical protein QOJ29_786, partial [Thermoleophilaceae bacterium]|nr:hypothetical protein [Thermoleophilaceae bacterium]
VEINQAVTERLGYTREAVIGRRSDALVAPTEWKRIDPEWKALLRNGHFTGDREILTADGHHARSQLASRMTRILGRQLVLTVTIEFKLLPLSRRSTTAPDKRQLTKRELEIIHHVAMGERAHEIAEALSLSPSTVQTHIRNAMAKTDARSQAQLVTIAFCRGLVDASLMKKET